MFDIPLRRLKDHLTTPLTFLIPPFITPNHLTLLAFLLGLLSCNAARLNQTPPALTFWIVNRLLDCLDGAIARRRGISSSSGGFLDLLSDFIIYSLLPISICLNTQFHPRSATTWLSVSILEASFHINNFLLFYSAAVAAERSDEELTSVTMRPALVEGFESGIIFTVMLARPEWLEVLCWGMAGAVGVGIVQRAGAIHSILRRKDMEERRQKATGAMKAVVGGGKDLKR